MIVSCGEALIDFIPARTEEGAAAYLPRPGGSLYNVAVALGRLGVPAGFAGGISTDFFGDRLVANLRESGVCTDYLARLDRPSTLAFASFDAAEPAYAFYDAEAADRHWQLPEAFPGAEVAAVHCGSLALVREPARAAFEELLARTQARGKVVSLDPNIRPEQIGDPPEHRARLRRLAGFSDIVKLSLADLAWLAPASAPADYAQSLLQAGASLVVVTAGGGGATAYGRTAKVTCPAEPVQVADTVGAGDAFLGGLLAGLWDGGHLDRAVLPSLGEAALREALLLALRVAALTCGRIGAEPPWRRELPVA